MERTATEQWREVGNQVFVRRHRAWDLNVGLVVGDGACLVIDTRASAAEGRDLAAAVRRVTSAPWTVVNTHGHFDHCFGNTVFRPAAVWGHRRCAEELWNTGDIQRGQLLVGYAEAGRPDLVNELSATRLDPPDHLVDATAQLDVGGRVAHLRHLGRGHTDADLVIHIPDADVLFAGDLVEEGAPPSFEDSYPLDWPATLSELMPLVSGPVVPGHGDVVGLDHVRTQLLELTDLARIARAAWADGRPVEDAVAELPYGGSDGQHAIDRAFAQLVTMQGSRSNGRPRTEP